MAVNTWSSAGSTDGNNVGNWSLGALNATDDLTFDNTSVVNCTMTANWDCASITFNSNYTGAFSDGGFDVANVSGAVTINTGGAFTATGEWVQDADANFTLTAASSWTISAWDIDLQGTGNLAISQITIIHKLICGANGKTTTKTGNFAFRCTQFECGAGTFSVGTQSFVAVDMAADGDIVLTGGHTLSGTAALYIVGNTASTTYNIPAVNATVTNLYFGGANASVVLTFSGDVTSTGTVTNYHNFDGTGTTFNYGSNTFTLLAFVIGNYSAARTATHNMSSAALSTTGAFNTSTINTGISVINAQTSTLAIGAWFVLGSNTTWTAGTETITFNSTTACTATFAGETVHDIIIAKTGGSWTASDAISCTDFTVQAANTVAVSWSGTTLTAGGDVVIDGSGTLDCGNGITVNGASSNVHFGSTLGTVTATNCALTFNTATAGVLDDDKAIIFTREILGANAIVTHSGAAASQFVQSVNPGLTFTNGGTLTLNGGAGPLYETITNNGYIVAVLAGSPTIAGAGNIDFKVGAASITVKMSPLNYTGTGVLTFSARSARNNSTILLAGNLSAPNATLVEMKSGNRGLSFNDGGYNITCPALNFGGNVSGYTTNFTFTGTHDINGAVNGTLYNSGTINITDTATWNVSGNVTLLSAATYTNTTSTMNLDGSGAQSITSNGKTIGNLVVANTGGTTSLADALSCTTLDSNDGIWDSNGKAITSAGSITFDSTGDAITLDAAMTITGDGDFHIAATTGTLTMTGALTMQGDGDFDWNKNAVHTYGNFTFGSAGKTITFTGVSDLIMNDNQLIIAHSTGAIAGDVSIIFTDATQTDPIVTNGSTWSVNALSEFDIRPSAAMTMNIPSINATNLDIDLRPYHTAAGTVKFDISGDITCGQMICNTQYGNVAEFDFNTHTISINNDYLYFHNNSIANTTVTCGSATFVLADGVDLNIATESGKPVLFNCGTSDWTIGGDLTISQFTTFDEGTATWLLNGSGAQAVTVNGNTLGAVTINNTGGTTQLQDAFICGNFTLTDGAFDMNGQTMSCANITITSTDTKTLDAAVTASGDGDYNVAVTFARLILSAATTHTFKAGVDFTLSSYTTTDWDDTILLSDSAGNAWGFVNPASMAVSGINVTDSTASNDIDAYTSTNTDGGGNTKWIFTIGGVSQRRTRLSMRVGMSNPMWP